MSTSSRVMASQPGRISLEGKRSTIRSARSASIEPPVACAIAWRRNCLWSVSINAVIPAQIAALMGARSPSRRKESLVCPSATPATASGRAPRRP